MESGFLSNDYRVCCVQDERHAKAVLYHSPKTKKAMLVITDKVTSDEKYVGPFNAAEMEAMIRAMKDALSMKDEMQYLE